MEAEGLDEVLHLEGGEGTSVDDSVRILRLAGETSFFLNILATLLSLFESDSFEDTMLVKHESDIFSNPKSSE